MIVARLAIPYAGRQPSKITLGNSQRRLGDFDLSAIAQYVGDVSSTALIAVPGMVAYVVYQLGGDLAAAAQAQISARNYMLSAGSGWNLGGLASVVSQTLKSLGSAAANLADAAASALRSVGSAAGQLSATAATIMTAMQLGGLGLGGYLLYSLLSN